MKIISKNSIILPAHKTSFVHQILVNIVVWTSIIYQIHNDLKTVFVITSQCSDLLADSFYSFRGYHVSQRTKRERITTLRIYK